MLWVNIIMDALAGLAFAGESPLPSYMHEPPKRLDEPILSRSMVWQVVWMGAYTIALCLVFLKSPTMQRVFRYDPENTTYFMTAFFALFIFCGVFNSFNARTPRIYLLSHLRENPAFVVVMVVVTVVQLSIIYYGGSMFRTVGLRLQDLGLILSLAFWVVPCDLIRKIVRRLVRSGAR